MLTAPEGLGAAKESESVWEHWLGSRCPVNIVAEGSLVWGPWLSLGPEG